jgi:hypothetical protein
VFLEGGDRIRQIVAAVGAISCGDWHRICTSTCVLLINSSPKAHNIESYMERIQMSCRRFILSLLLVILFGTMTFANATTVNMNFLGPGANNSGGYYTYPYYFSINGGQATAMMCDSFNNHISTGDTWSAQVNGLLSGKGLFGKDNMDYKAAGIIFLGVMNGTISATDGNWAVWNLFSKGITNDASVLALDLNALRMAKTAPSSEFRGLKLYTPVGASPGHGPQEFIGYGSRLATPEPGTLLLLSTGLMGMAGLIRKKLGS